MKYQNSRREFLKVGFLSSTVVIMSGCDVFGFTTPKETIALLQFDLFPKAKELGVDTVGYMSIILHHSRISKEDKKFIRNGVKWLNEEAVKLYATKYIKLAAKEREAVLVSVAKEEWGASWLDSMMRYILEATLGDPIYGSNKNEAGWKWLAFEGGKPRPKKAYL